MRIPVLKGTIKRRLLVNFRADPAVVQRLLPPPFRPKLQRGQAIVGVCLIRLEQVRPSRFPGGLGLSSENAAHRIAVEWPGDDGLPKEGVFIPRRDTGSLLNLLAGGKLFPGEHHAAKFSVSDESGHVNFSMRSNDGDVVVKVIGDNAETIPTSSCFGSVDEASAFFEGGSLGYSVTRDGSRLDGLVLRTLDWRIKPLTVSEVQSSYFADRKRFPEGSIVFDHALIMRDVDHEWHKAADLFTVPRAGQA